MVAKKVVKKTVAKIVKKVMKTAEPAKQEKKGVAPVVTVFKELADATQEDPKKNEKFADYAIRLCTKVSELSDGDFDQLSPAAQTWFNETVAFINDGKKDSIKPLAGFEVKTSTVGKAAAPEQGTLPGVEKPTKMKKEKLPPARMDGVAHRVRSLVVAKPAISFADVCSKVGVEAKVGGHAFNIYNEAKRVMELVAAQP